GGQHRGRRVEGPSPRRSHPPDGWRLPAGLGRRAHGPRRLAGSLLLAVIRPKGSHALRIPALVRRGADPGGLLAGLSLANRGMGFGRRRAVGVLAGVHARALVVLSV